MGILFDSASFVNTLGLGILDAPERDWDFDGCRNRRPRLPHQWPLPGLRMQPRGTDAAPPSHLPQAPMDETRPTGRDRIETREDPSQAGGLMLERVISGGQTG